MSKYINASEAEMIIESEAEYLYGEGLDVSAHRMWKLQNQIRDMPSADVVEVVRCKDCKFYREVMKDCTHKFGMVKAKPNDFCNYGERRETDER